MDPNTPEVTPAAPEVTPVAPEAAPVEPVTPDPVTEPTQEETDAKEWEEATDELFPGVKSTKKEGEDDEPTKPEEGTKTPKEGEVDPNETPEQKAAREQAEADAAATVADPAAAIARDVRVAAREAAQQTAAIATDIKEKMYPDLPETLIDGQGDPIETVEDVMKLINPLTDEPFTPEEAGMWLASAQQQFNKSITEINKRIETIAELNLDIKDQADAINEKYGDLLKKDTDLRDRVWAAFSKTLEKDAETDVIIKAPVSLQEFYELALAPYAAQASKPAEPTPPAGPTPEEKAAQEEARRKQNRSDRSDIFGGAAPDAGLSEDEKEWAEAANNVFGK